MPSPFIRQALVLSLIALAQTVSATPSLDKFDLTFSDEFNGASLDTSKWSTRYLWGPYVPINGEEQYYVDTTDLDQGFSYSPFELTGSSLIIRAIKTSASIGAPTQPVESDPLWSSSPDLQYIADYVAEDRHYLSGIITSIDHFNFTHGYVETRAKLPAGTGLWSAFWLLNTKYVEDVPENRHYGSFGPKQK